MSKFDADTWALKCTVFEYEETICTCKCSPDRQHPSSTSPWTLNASPGMINLLVTFMIFSRGNLCIIKFSQYKYFNIYIQCDANESFMLRVSLVKQKHRKRKFASTSKSSNVVHRRSICSLKILNWLRLAAWQPNVTWPKIYEKNLHPTVQMEGVQVRKIFWPDQSVRNGPGNLRPNPDHQPVAQQKMCQKAYIENCIFGGLRKTLKINEKWKNIKRNCNIKYRFQLFLMHNFTMGESAFFFSKK